jgi:hypothetical protein
MARECAAHRFKMDVDVSFSVNNHAGWQTVANDATAWTNYLADTNRPPTYSIIDKIVELTDSAVDTCLSYLGSYNNLAVHAPNEVTPNDWSGTLVGGSQTYTFHECCRRFYAGLKAAHPGLTISSPVIHGYWGDYSERPASEIAAMGTGLTNIENNRTTHYEMWDEWNFNFYLSVREATGGVRKFEDYCKTKLATVYPKMLTLARGKPLNIQEFGVDMRMCNLSGTTLKNAYQVQGEYIDALYRVLNQYGFNKLTLYTLGADDETSTRMYGGTVGTTTVDTTATVGGARANMRQLLHSRGYQSDAPPAGMASSDWVAGPALLSAEVPASEIPTGFL